MTLIVACKDSDGSLWMGSDALQTSGWADLGSRQSKLCRQGPWLIGCSGDIRAIQLVTRYTCFPEPPPTQSEINGRIRWMGRTVGEHMRNALRDGGWEPDGNSSLMVLAVNGQDAWCDTPFWKIWHDGTVVPIQRPYAAVGDGTPWAEGALAVLDSSFSARTRLLCALDATAQHCRSVCAPWHVERVPQDG